MLSKKLLIFIVTLLTGFTTGRELSFAYIAVPDQATSYKAVVAYQNGYVAVGQGCGIVYFSQEGDILSSIPAEKTGKLNDLVLWNDMLVAGGEGVLVSVKGDELQIKKLDKEIFSMTVFKGKLIAAAGSVGGSSGGELLIFNDPDAEAVEKKLGLKGQAVKVSSSNNDCYGVTSEGEIFYSKDGANWRSLDFNANYAGYYSPISSAVICVAPTSIALAAVDQNGQPAFYTSSRGTVWSPRLLVWTEDGEQKMLEDLPLGLEYDALADQFIMTCTAGTVFTLPACSHCNTRLSVPANEIYDVAVGNDGMLMVVGSDGYADVISR